MVDEYIIHHDASLCLHITISIKQDIIIFMVKTCLSCANAKSSLLERAMGAFFLSNILTLLQTKHLKEQLFNILVALMKELQVLGTKHVHNFILVVDKPRERAIVRQGCDNQSIIVIIASNTWERAIVQHIACNRS
jgi:hypothetical protein